MAEHLNLMTVGELRERLADFPDNIPVGFWLNPNGTNHEGDFYISYPSSTGEPKHATKLTLRECVSDEDEARDFPDQARIGLPEEFLELCARDGVSPEAVLHSFIADLCELHNYISAPRADKLSSNGSDERRLANEYYDRCGFAYLNQEQN